MHSKVSSAQFKNTVYSSNIDGDAPFSLNLGTLCHPDSVGPYFISSAQSCHARKREMFSKDLLSERTKQYLKGRSTSSCGGYHLPFIPPPLSLLILDGIVEAQTSSAALLDGVSTPSSHFVWSLAYLKIL